MIKKTVFICTSSGNTKTRSSQKTINLSKKKDYSCKISIKNFLQIWIDIFFINL
jgi:hypothetical protein